MYNIRLCLNGYYCYSYIIFHISHIISGKKIFKFTKCRQFSSLYLSLYIENKKGYSDNGLVE